MKKNSKEKIARVYSSALYAVAKDAKVVEKVRKDLSALQEVLSADESLPAQMSSPLLTAAEINTLLGELETRLGLCKETVNFLQVLVSSSKLRNLGMVADDFSRLYYQDNNIAEVVVETVKALSPAQDKKLRSALVKRFGRQVELDYQITPSILGGMRILCGSELLDASLNSKLNNLENLMKGK